MTSQVYIEAVRDTSVSGHNLTKLSFVQSATKSVPASHSVVFQSDVTLTDCSLAGGGLLTGGRRGRELPTGGVRQANKQRTANG